MNMEAQCTPSRSAILTGRYAIRSGTHSVPFGGVADGLTQWEVTMAESVSAAGYATALYGKWHLGSHDGRFPNDQGFDEWYGIPRTTDEAMWPGSPGYSPSIMPSGAMRPILLAKFSVNQRSPSGPTQTLRNEAFGVVTLYSIMPPFRSMRHRPFAEVCTNQIDPSG